ncbi:acyl-CoA dehydrogenase family protein [Bacillus sp. AFS088145]|uniref:acyl-CoA dehydrogenase family protein n=1 Tax=Bacillus sp. AFS088145 TaxID=2033514 RepID=UPI000BF9F5E7|nr:acyl-CoA dehydrogenase family protein [Bacillus sp. AFS088145]PFH88093.1 acyl-CoA dehydrogenase [Bacillus sp. AFS088145]
MGDQKYTAKSYLKEEHLVFRKSLRKFLEKEALPFYEQWEENKIVPKSFWKKMGDMGYLCPWADEKYGGFKADFGYSIVIQEELCKVGSGLGGLNIHNNVIMPYIERYGTNEQKKRWFPRAISGDLISAIAMTEPGTGSDLAKVKTNAVRKGNHFIINGEKTFISNGINTNFVIVVCRTNPNAESPHKGISLIVVEEGTPGFSKGKQLKKLGQHAYDTSELIFEDAVVPVENLIGEENKGFYHLMEKLQQERLMVAVSFITFAERMLEITMNYVKERTVFGQQLSKFQNTQFRIAEMATEIQLGRTFVDQLIEKHIAGENIVTEVSMSKWWITNLAKKIAPLCLQLHGGYGFMEEYEIARMYRDVVAGSIYAGSNEIMKGIIAKNLGL